MGNMDIFNIIKSYCKDKMSIIIKFIIFMFIFFWVYSLYHLPLDIFLYASLLVITSAFLCSLFDLNKYYRKHKELQNILNQIEYKLDRFPESKSLIERDYEDIINALYENKIKLSFDLDNKYDEMIDYYTMWAHQIKTPISAFSMILQSMEGSLEKAIMKQELFKINEYVEMVLYYARLKNVSFDLKLQQYSIRNIIKNVLKKFSSTFIYKKISLKLDDFDFMVVTDEKWITFVIEQILSNALKYTNKGSIFIYMDENAHNTLVIKDTGIGIAEEDIPQVFEKGFTGYNGRMDKKSTGIGLYLCKQIITKLSHKIYLTSKIGEGTEVYIDFSVNDIKIE